MAVKKTAGSSGGKAVKKSSSDRSSAEQVSGIRIFLLWMLLFVFLIVIGGIIWLFWLIPGKLMHENPRFIVRRFEVESSGYWAGRGDELVAKINALNEKELICKNQTNIFSVDVASVRKTISNIRSIQNAEVHLVLPDMIVFKLNERIPRAVFAANGYVVDENAEMFPLKESLAADTERRLPEIRGSKAMLREAIDLIMTANRDCEDIVIYSIDTAKYRDRLEVILTYRNDRPWVVWFPVDGRNYNILLNRLKNLIIQTSIEGKRYTGFDLRPSDYAVPL